MTSVGVVLLGVFRLFVRVVRSSVCFVVGWLLSLFVVACVASLSCRELSPLLVALLVACLLLLVIVVSVCRCADVHTPLHTQIQMGFMVGCATVHAFFASF